MCIGLTFISDSFATSTNIFNVLRQISVNVFLACGMTMVILIGGIDLSVGSVIAISGCLCAGLITNNGIPSGLAIILAIIIGTLVGAVNGLIIANTKIPPFIVTLAMMNIGRGFARIYTNATQYWLMMSCYLDWKWKNIWRNTCSITVYGCCGHNYRFDFE